MSNEDSLHNVLWRGLSGRISLATEAEYIAWTNVVVPIMVRLRVADLSIKAGMPDDLWGNEPWDT